MKLKILTSLFFLFGVWGCWQPKLKQATDCGCITQEPEIGELTVYFTRDTMQRSPKIIILGGYYEEFNVLDTISTDTIAAYKNYLTLYLPVDHYYTAVAIYIRNTDTIYAVDGDYLYKNSYYDSDCDTICWKINGNTLNVKLKKFRL